MPELYVPQWRYIPPGNALPWKIMFLEPDILVCENRFRETGRTFFSALSLQSGKEILSDFSLEDHFQAITGTGNMAGLETARGNLFYIHGYQDNSPEHRGIWAVDPLKGVIAWARPEAVFVANHPDGMLVYASGAFAGFPERSYYLLDTERGEVLDTIGSNVERANRFRRESLSDEELQKVQLPRKLESGCSFSGLSEEEFSEYIERDELFITAIHTSGKSGKGFDAVIRAHRNGKRVYDDVLGTSTAVPSVNYFLLRRVTLYYIRNTNELVSVRLSCRE